MYNIAHYYFYLGPKVTNPKYVRSSEGETKCYYGNITVLQTATPSAPTTESTLLPKIQAEHSLVYDRLSTFFFVLASVSALMVCLIIVLIVCFYVRQKKHIWLLTLCNPSAYDLVPIPHEASTDV